MIPYGRSSGLHPDGTFPSLTVVVASVIILMLTATGIAPEFHRTSLLIPFGNHKGRQIYQEFLSITAYLSTAKLRTGFTVIKKPLPFYAKGIENQFNSTESVKGF